MLSADSEIKDANLVTEIFGYWPQFHDAERLSFYLSRGNLDPETDSWEFPSIEAKVHVFEMTSELTPKGYFILHKHHLVDFRFEGVDELHLEGFNHQNAMQGLNFKLLDDGPLRFEVTLDGAFGADARFLCSRVIVAGVLPCGPNGSHAPNQSFNPDATSSG